MSGNIITLTREEALPILKLMLPRILTRQNARETARALGIPVGKDKADTIQNLIESDAVERVTSFKTAFSHPIFMGLMMEGDRKVTHRAIHIDLCVDLKKEYPE